MRWVLICISFMWSVSAFAGLQTTYSREHNFTNPTIKNQANERRVKSGQDFVATATDDVEGVWAARLVQYIRKQRPYYKVSKVRGKWGKETVFKNPHGGGFKISIDPGSVEVQTDPETIAETEARIEDHRFLFEAFASVGLEPDLFSHLNYGVISAFGDDVESFVRYLADWSNRREGYEVFVSASVSLFLNAPPLQQLAIHQQQEFVELLNRVGAKEVTTIQEAADWMNERVYSYSPVIRLGYSHARHYQAIGLKYLSIPHDPKVDQPVEHREMRQPPTPEEDLLVRKLIDQRIEYVKTLKGTPLSYIPQLPTWMEKDDLLRRKNWSRIAFELIAYTAEMNENWTTYEAILSPELRKYMNEKHEFLEGFFNGNVDWSFQPFVAEFVTSVASRFNRSPWMENHILKILRESMPADFEHADFMIQRLSTEFKYSPEVLAPFLEKLKTIHNLKTSVDQYQVEVSPCSKILNGKNK